METNCAPILNDLFHYSYEAAFIRELLRNINKKLALSFNFMFHYICSWCHHIELFKGLVTILNESIPSILNLGCNNYCSNWQWGLVENITYGKREDSGFQIMIFPFIHNLATFQQHRMGVISGSLNIRQGETHLYKLCSNLIEALEANWIGFHLNSLTCEDFIVLLS